MPIYALQGLRVLCGHPRVSGSLNPETVTTKSTSLGKRGLGKFNQNGLKRSEECFTAASHGLIFRKTETLGIYKQRAFTFYFYLWLTWVFVAVHGLSLVAGGSSPWWLLLLQSLGSRRVGFASCGPRALEHRFSSCGVQAFLLQGVWDLPLQGMEPMSPALAS